MCYSTILITAQLINATTEYKGYNQNDNIYSQSWYIRSIQTKLDHTLMVYISQVVFCPFVDNVLP